MLVVGLVSGGKDSCYNLLQTVAAGHKVVALANLQPKSKANETDSQMFQTVGWNNVNLLAEAMDLPLYVETTDMVAKTVTCDYEPTEDDEVEDLYNLLARVQREAGVQAVSVGAILSDYQRVRVEGVCLRLGLTSLSYLWRRDQKELLKDMIYAGMESVLVKVACLCLNQQHLGQSLSEIEPHLTNLAAKFGVNVCGEGGEFETFTLNSPLFRRRLALTDSSVVVHSNDAIAPVCLLLLNLELEGEYKEGTQEQLLGDKLLRTMASNEYALPFVKLTNEPSLPSIGDLNLLDYSSIIGPKFVNEEDGWFSVIGICGQGDDPEKVVYDAFSKLTSLLADFETGLDNVVKISMYVDTMANYKEMNAAYITHFGLNPPVRVCVAVGSSCLPQGTRILLGAEGHHHGRGKVMHVQSISHWAPANIGPYSQGVLGSRRLYVSGQIGLIPGSMLLAHDEASQAGLGLRHVARVAEAMQPTLLWNNVKTAICYVVNNEAAKQAKCQWKLVGAECDVTFYQVSELPRGALVEWEIVYNTDT